MKGVILSGGKADQSICQVFGDVPTALIPVNGKPIIFHVISRLIELGISEVYITIGFQKDKIINYVEKNRKFIGLKIQYVEVDELKKPGVSLLNAFSAISGGGEVFVSLADTLCKLPDSISFEKDFVVGSKEFKKDQLWAIANVNAENCLNTISDKKKNNTNADFALIGIYFFKDIDIFNQYQQTDSKKNFEISSLLEFYNYNRKITVIEATEWLDFGHIERYQIAKKRLLEAREFNSLTFDDLIGTITKRSSINKKFVAEIKWLISLPKSLMVLAPRVIDYSLDEKDAFVTMEYYSYQTMAEIWLFSEFSTKTLKAIIDKVYSVLMLFAKEKRIVPKKDYNAVYVEKTIYRIKKLISLNNPTFNTFLYGDSDGFVTINGQKLKPWSVIRSEIIDLLSRLYDDDHNCLIHGDFCFSNVLYNINSGVVRLIDPRGIWGGSCNGDIKYDLAKLRHSIVGDYDFIVNDFFTVNYINGNFSYEVPINENQLSIKKYFDDKVSSFTTLSNITLIEGILFLSMVPLHSNSETRQLAMLCKAIEKLNSLI